MPDKPILEIYALVAEWYNEEFIKPKIKPNLKEYGQVFTHIFEPFTHKKTGTHTWSISINGQEYEEIDPIGRCNIQPFHLHVYRNEWLVAICSPYEGNGVYGLDNQFIELLEYLLKQKRKEQLEVE